MILIKPVGSVDLGHSAYFLRGAPDGSMIVVASRGGQLSLLGPDLTSVRSQRQLPGIRAVSPHPSGRCLAIVDSVGSLVVRNLSGEPIIEIAGPPMEGDASRGVEQGFEDCLFSDSGEFIVLVHHRTPDECEIGLIETVGWSLVAQATVTDRFGSSSCSFHRTDRPGLVSMWVAAGQDGQRVFWVSLDRNRFAGTLEPRLRNTTPPVFSPSGDHLLVLSEDGAIRKYSWPEMQSEGRPVCTGNKDDEFAESLAHLSDRRALALSNEGLLFLLDTERMEISDSVTLEGHEPRSVGDYYPSLAHEPGLATDVAWMQRHGDNVFFSYGRDRNGGIEGWRDALGWFSVKRRD